MVNTLRLILTFTIVNFAWVFFRITNLPDVFLVFKKILTEHGSPFVDADTLFYAVMFAILLFIIEFMEEHFKGRIKVLSSKHFVVRWSAYIAMVMMILLFGVLDGGSFIYFQF